MKSLDLSAENEAPQTEIFREPIADRSAWLGKDLKGDASWTYVLSPEDIEEIENASAIARERVERHEDIRAEDFPLETLSKKLHSIRDDLENDRGLFLLKGVPIEEYTVDEIEFIYAGIASHLGWRIVQDTQGTLIDHVYDRGLSYNSIAVRGYTTNAHLTPHCDSGDLVVLLCVRPAKSGGINILTSSMSIYNEVLRKHPELLEILYRGFHYNIRGNGPPGPWENITKHRVPIYSFYEGKLSCRYNQKAIKTSEQLPGVEPLTEKELAAIEVIAELANAPDLRFEYRMDAGDILFLNNHVVLHNRTEFEDHEEPERKRLLMRLWLNLDKARSLTHEFADHYNTGPREGPFVHNSPSAERIR